MEWWGYSEYHGWIMVDKTLTTNKPEVNGLMIIISCDSDKVFIEHSNQLNPPKYIDEKDYLSKYIMSNLKLLNEKKNLSRYKSKVAHYKKLCRNSITSFSKLEKEFYSRKINDTNEINKLKPLIPKVIAKNDQSCSQIITNKVVERTENNTATTNSTNNSSTLEKFFGIDIEFGAFVWIFWAFLASLISPLFGAIVLIVLMGMSFSKAFDKDNLSKKNIHKKSYINHKYGVETVNEKSSLRKNNIRKIKKTRVTHCHNCKGYLDDMSYGKCKSCYWIKCSCGACGCDFN